MSKHLVNIVLIIIYIIMISCAVRYKYYIPVFILTIVTLYILYKNLYYNEEEFNLLNLFQKNKHNELLDENDKVYTSFSNDPLNYYKTDNSLLTGPYVDGEEDSMQSMFMFHNNKTHSSCCHHPGSYSASSGCVCLTEEQQNFLKHRGIV
jgi:hypothetical protein